MDTYEALSRAIATTEPIVAGVQPGQLGTATPCTEWDARALLNHVVGVLWLAAGLLSDTAPRHALPPGGLPEGDVLGDDPATAYKEAADAALAAAGIEGTFEAIHQAAFGEMPGQVIAGFTTIDLLVHGWDLATATGQAPAFDEGVAEHALGFARQAVTDDRREPLIGPAVAVLERAPVMDRLVGFMGRRP